MQVSYPQAETTGKPPKIIVILGHTASGKSELAVKLANKFNGEIISADSRQVYRGLDIGSGKVPRDKSKIKNQKSKLQFKNQSYFYKGIRHHLLDVASPKRTFTVVQYQKLAKKTLQNIIKRGKIPIICGGTGLYIDSLIYDYKFPKVPPRQNLRKKLEKLSTEKLFEKLQKIDPRRAKNIDKHNRRRLIRALEIVIATGKSTPKWDNNFPHWSATALAALKIGIKKSAEELKKLIRKRLIKRLKSGMIDEVKNLHEKPKLNWQRLDALGLEYRYVSRYLRGLITYDEMKWLIQKESEKYAKRQMTWFKRDSEIIWIDNPKKAYAICRDWLSP